MGCLERFCNFAIKYRRVGGTSFIEIISVSAIFGMSLNLGNSTDIYGTNKYQRLRYSAGWTYLRKWVFLGPWDIDKRLSALFHALRFFV